MTANNLIFVVDNDFGALGVVMYMLRRQPLAQQSLILLPRRAYELHGATLSVACKPYDSLPDILAAVEAHAPRVAYLYSGYLLAAQRLLSVGELGRLVRALGARGCKVATSDPYIGTFARLPDAQLPPRGLLRYLGPVGEWLQGKALRRHVTRVEDILREATHLYPVKVDLPASGRPRRLSFFNPLYVSADVPRAPAPQWLFVIAQFDLEFQEQKFGAARFAELVALRMREAIAQGRHPTFIGPRSITQALSAHFLAGGEATILATCPFEEFERRLLDAEAAFYWQIFSTSGFLRLWSGLPVFFFDPGANSRLLGEMHTNGIDSHFMGHPPIGLDIERPLEAIALANHRAYFRTAAGEVVARLAPLPDPAELFAAIAASR